MSAFYKILFGGILLLSNQIFGQGKIIMNGATMKLAYTAYVVTGDVSLTSGSTINVNNSTIKIAGNITNNSGIFDVTSGTVEMNGSSPQTIPSAAFYTNKIQNLVISNGVTLGGQDSITEVLSFGSSNNNFATAGLLTIKSTSQNTARVADITNNGSVSGNSISGNVHVERYISSMRAWRLLTAPTNVSGAQTINAAWQEGQVGTNTIPGFGIQVTGGTTANGFDQGVNSNAAIKKLVGGSWVGLANTNSTLVTSQPGYMVFIRGDRGTNLSQGIYAAPSSTVLRSTGVLKTNDQSYTVAATGFTVVSNPFASAMDLNNLSKVNSTNVQDNFYLWDPRLTGSNGVGGYVDVSWNGSSYDITPSSGGSGLDQYIQSGAAFLARSADASSPGTLIIKETDKSATASTNVNRPLSNSTGKLKTNLFTINNDGTTPVVDGILNSFDDMYSNSIDAYDAVKMTNFSENLSTMRNGTSLCVERKQLITEADTIFLNMLQMKVKSYKFEFIADNFNSPGLTGFLEDSYLNTNTAIDLAGTTTYNFNVINVPGSWNPSRFRIVFRPSGVLPLTFSSVKAYQQNNNIQVEWKVENEVNIKQYEIERSADGRQFTKAYTTISRSNSSGSLYNWLDTKPFNGNNFYRIKSVDENGAVHYSSIVKVFTGDIKQGITIPGNVINNGIITLNLVNMPAGSYGIKIINSIGQLIQTKQIEHIEGTSSETIQLKNIVAKGVYILEVIQPDNKRITNKIIL